MNTLGIYQEEKKEEKKVPYEFKTEMAELPTSFDKYYCRWSRKHFNTLSEIGDCPTCDACSMLCDRKYYKNFVRNNLKGQYMEPLSKDPISKVSVKYTALDDDERITRIIKY